MAFHGTSARAGGTGRRIGAAHGKILAWGGGMIHAGRGYLALGVAVLMEVVRLPRADVAAWLGG